MTTTPTEVLEALRYLLVDVLSEHHGLGDIAEHMTCTEAEAMAAAVRLLGGTAEAEELLSGHARSDEQDDPEAIREGHEAAAHEFAAWGTGGIPAVPVELDEALAEVARASCRGDEQAYRAAMAKARAERATDRQLKDAWEWGWMGYAGERSPIPRFDWLAQLPA